ncbi:Bgt-2702 [Blumeria graminis f. sp. tritici]|uniref:Bgt-2702 n=2 Tax=Blumeria graminis f. sp. tritici TaxID=62690 RepID=A0A381LFR2_BLUGR|nr:hypothetical protein BGT96224_2702 [Blumeria graminis f. sp. tritici 96224]VCU41179.1 Bgt-2702 [Blumeria graminis f. sp. tritici]
MPENSTLIRHVYVDRDDDLDSLPSSDYSNDSSDTEQSDAQHEWETSLQQLEHVLTMIIVPYAGKYLGRKFAFWSWAKYMTWIYPVPTTFKTEKYSEATGSVETATIL